ncbi:MAG: metallophosphoesterase family protein [Candidatus Hodarchaeales archaeon]|jgi:predicted phosphodiesterase
MKRSITILIFLGFTLFLSSIIVTGSNNIRENTKGITSSSWHFVALGDSRQQHGDWDYDNNKYFHDNSSNPTRAALITSVVENNPNMEFIIHTGDLVNSGGEQDDWNRYYEDIENATKANVTIYNAIGNHELYTYALEPSQWGPADEDYSTYLENVELPGNERYYSFDFMNQIHFVFINTEEDWTGEFSITTDQNDWLINDLTTNTLEFIVAVFHRPCYSVRDAGRVQDAKDVRLVLDPIFIEYGVDLVFSGHDHQYYKTIRNGIAYVTTGGAGADLYTNGDTSEWQEGDEYFSEFHYCNISVTESAGVVTMDVEVFIFNEIDHSATLGDSFSVTSGSIDDTSTSSTSSDTTSKQTFLPTFTTFLGILPLLLIRKRK